MACFDNFIGIKGCDNSTLPKSGYYIQDLEGISITSVANIANDSSGRTLLEEKISFAIKQTATDVMAMLPNLDFNAYAETLRGYCFKDNTANGQPSQTITKSNFYAPNGKLTASRVIIKLDEDVLGAVLEITDGTNILESFTIDISQGVEFVQELSVQSTTGILTARITTPHDYFIAPKTLFAWQSGIAAVCCKRACDSDYLESTAGNGIVIDAAIICDPDKVICKLLHPLKDAILYRAGIEILNEWIATDRVNFLAIHGQEWAQNKIAEWRGVFEQKVNFALTSTAVKNLQKNDPVCFDCGGNKFGYAL